MTTTVDLARYRPDTATLLWGALLVNTEIALVLTYVFLSGNTITDWVPVVVPFVWINVGVWAVVRTRIGPASQRRRTVAVAIAAAYFVVLAYFAGMIGPGLASQPTSYRIALASVPPGWAPALLANTPWIQLSVLPYQLIGYVALSYLLFATVVDTARSAVGGVLGLLSCVSCTWPVLASILTGVLGSGAVLTTVALDRTYALSTVVFVVTVALLYWRPGIGDHAARVADGDQG